MWPTRANGMIPKSRMISGLSATPEKSGGKVSVLQNACSHGGSIHCRNKPASCSLTSANLFCETTAADQWCPALVATCPCCQRWRYAGTNNRTHTHNPYHKEPESHCMQHEDSSKRERCLRPRGLACRHRGSHSADLVGEKKRENRSTQKRPLPASKMASQVDRHERGEQAHARGRPASPPARCRIRATARQATARRRFQTPSRVPWGSSRQIRPNSGGSASANEAGC